MGKYVRLAAATIALGFGQLAVAQNASPAARPTPPPPEPSRQVLRIAETCGVNNSPVAECIATYVVPAGYTAILETVSMAAGGHVIDDARVEIVGTSTAVFRLPRETAAFSSTSGTYATALAGRITAVAGEQIKLDVVGGSAGIDYTVAASGYLVPSDSSSLAP